MAEYNAPSRQIYPFTSFNALNFTGDPLVGNTLQQVSPVYYSGPTGAMGETGPTGPTGETGPTGGYGYSPYPYGSYSMAAPAQPTIIIGSGFQVDFGLAQSGGDPGVWVAGPLNNIVTTETNFFTYGFNVHTSSRYRITFTYDVSVQDDALTMELFVNDGPQATNLDVPSGSLTWTGDVDAAYLIRPRITLTNTDTYQINSASMLIEDLGIVGPTGPTGPTGSTAFGLGNAWYFDGSTAVVTPSSDVFDIGTEFQVDAWICPTRLDDGDNCLWYFKYRENEHTWDNSMGTIQLRTDGGFDIIIANQPSWTVGVGLQKVNAWNHICLTLKDGFNYFYFNGVLVDSLANNRTYSERQVYLGVQKPDGYNNFYEGYISQFRFLTQVLYTTDFVPPLFVLEPTATTGLLTCQATELLDRSSNAFTLTLDAGTFTTTQYIPYGAATGPTGPSGVSVADGTYSPVTSITILNGVITAIT